MTNNIRQILIVNDGPNAGQAYVLQDAICTLGRTPDNAIVIDSPRISRHHAQIRLLPNGATIEDMGSTNGTWVNDKKLTGPHRLSSGDIIDLADYISFRFEVETEMRTEKLPSTDFDHATQAMTDTPDYASPPPSPPAYQEAYARYEQRDDAPTYPPPAATPYIEPQAPPPKQRSKWVYVIVVILLITICLCLAAAVYLWFAPVEFWQQIFQLFGIPMP